MLFNRYLQMSYILARLKDNMRHYLQKLSPLTFIYSFNHYLQISYLFAQQPNSKSNHHPIYSI